MGETANEKVILDAPEAIGRHLRSAIGPEDRAAHGVRYVFCDADSAVVHHAHVGPLPTELSEGECTRMASVFASAVGERRGFGLLVAIVRPATTSVGTQDRRWFRAVHRACAAHSVRLLGVYIVGRTAEREVRVDDGL